VEFVLGTSKFFNDSPLHQSSNRGDWRVPRWGFVHPPLVYNTQPTTKRGTVLRASVQGLDEPTFYFKWIFEAVSWGLLSSRFLSLLISLLKLGVGSERLLIRGHQRGFRYFNGTVWNGWCSTVLGGYGSFTPRGLLELCAIMRGL
jgi:hypothetical protein